MAKNLRLSIPDELLLECGPSMDLWLFERWRITEKFEEDCGVKQIARRPSHRFYNIAASVAAWTLTDLQTLGDRTFMMMCKYQAETQETTFRFQNGGRRDIRIRTLFVEDIYNDKRGEQYFHASLGKSVIERWTDLVVGYVEANAI